MENKLTILYDYLSLQHLIIVVACAFTLGYTIKIREQLEALEARLDKTSMCAEP